jgi:hypothetical protein
MGLSRPDPAADGMGVSIQLKKGRTSKNNRRMYKVAGGMSKKVG